MVPSTSLPSTPSILITDDDRDFRETLRGVFETRGFCPRLAGDGEEALQIVETEQIHIVLLDMHMPRLTGLEAIRRVKAEHTRLPCILISAKLDDRLAAAAREAQAFSSLPKPIALSDLTQTVNRAMKSVYDWPAR